MSDRRNLLEDAKCFASEDKRLGIILFHAYTGSPTDVNLLARKLQREGYGVLCPLFAGHRTTDVFDILSQSLENWQAQAEAALKMMAAEYEQVMTFGLSMGGVFATDLMSHFPEQILAGGVFNSPVVTAQATDIASSFKQYCQHVYKFSHKEAAFVEDWPELLEGHRAQIAALDTFKAELYQRLEQIHQPYYIAQSLQDEIINESDAPLLRAALLNAQVDYHEFPENTHVITVNRDRAAFEASLFSFIQRALANDSKRE